MRGKRQYAVRIVTTRDKCTRPLCCSSTCFDPFSALRGLKLWKWSRLLFLGSRKPRPVRVCCQPTVISAATNDIIDVNLVNLVCNALLRVQIAYSKYQR